MNDIKLNLHSIQTVSPERADSSSAGQGVFWEKGSRSVAQVDGASIPHLKYYGGKVLKEPKFNSLYYGQYWRSKNGAAERRFNDRFAKNFVGSKHIDVLKEYGVNKAEFTGSRLIPARTTPRSVDELQVKKLIWTEIGAGRAPKPDGETVYTVHLPPGTVLQSSSGYSSLEGVGGYHGSFDLSDGKRVYFAVIAYSQGDNGIPFTANPRDNNSIVTSHEWVEAATDPDVNNGKLGWYDQRYGEIGDIPINQGLPLEKVWGRIGKYAVQKEWSNADGCSEILPGEC